MAHETISGSAALAQDGVPSRAHSVEGVCFYQFHMQFVSKVLEATPWRASSVFDFFFFFFFTLGMFSIVIIGT